MNAAFRKKNPIYQRWYLATRNQPDALRLPFHERTLPIIGEFRLQVDRKRESPHINALLAVKA